MVRLVNNTDKVIFGKTRVDGKWFDGILPNETIEVEDPYCVKALIKNGCEEVKVKKKAKAKKKKKIVKKKEVENG